jgi:predicted RNase H-like HicB family nuclease
MRGQALQLVDMIGREVAREAHNQQLLCLDCAELLGAHRAPLHHRARFPIEFADQAIGGLGGAGEGARKNLGVSDERSLPSASVAVFDPHNARGGRWNMRNEFTAIVEQDGPWYIAYCAEVPGANGQGKTREECLANLREAMALILEHRREESLRLLPPDAGQELVVVG